MKTLSLPSRAENVNEIIFGFKCKICLCSLIRCIVYILQNNLLNEAVSHDGGNGIANQYS